MSTKLVLHTDRISEEQQAQVDQLLNKIVPADIPVEKYNHLIELPWQGIYPDMESNSAWLQKLSLLIKEITENIEFNLRLLIDENKLVLQIGLETTQEQIAAINALLDRVLPRNLVTEIDEMPLGFARLEYLEGTGTQYIDTTRDVTSETGVKIEYEELQGDGTLHEVVGTRTTGNFWFPPRQSTGGAESNKQEFFYYTSGYTYMKNWGRVVVDLNYKNAGTLYLENLIGDTYQRALPSKKDIVLPPLKLFGSSPYSKFIGRIWRCIVTEGQEIVSHFLPAFDTEVGAPCMFDTTTRTPFYSFGTDDFTYPGKETEAITYSLRNRIYAQLTPNGIRRLYRVPTSYDGSKEEYAAENGFKLLIEPPMPEEGYWTPVWHDREDYIELEWVETEPPAEEYPIEEEFSVKEIKLTES